MKRVLSLATLYPNAAAPRFGTFVARSLEALAARRDWQVTVINPIGVPPVAFGRYRALKAAATDGVEHSVAVHRPTFPLVPRVGGRINPALIARTVLPLARRLHAEAPFDLVDAQFFYPDGPAAARIARALDLPLSIKARGSDIHYWSTRPWALAQMIAAGKHAGGLLAVSGSLAGDMATIGLPGDKVTVHYTGLDRDRFRPLQHTQLRRRLGHELGVALPDTAPVLVTLGALLPHKGQSLVIDALADLPERTVLLLVGRGDDEARLRAQARSLGVADRVHFLGSLDHDLLPLVLSAANAMVLPSAREGLANAWVEALACGTPLVITDAGGAREVLTAPEAGRIVARNARAIAEGVRELLEDPPQRQAVAAMAERFSWQTHAEALARYYESLLA
ncbi:glycosyltransferase [Altererythrobacter sp. TH136]|uniref:glycosyltransferase n=1 Tax=Altererythrobacter sp. TH136 TaxID=2067415 RepID=UPI0011626620|nr:glycosyltransferase [Altererythrobacter sp. TH136]QDM40473.1 glycosyltransferase family 4 protein [Altererythrobacter sp. TH136]